MKTKDTMRFYNPAESTGEDIFGMELTHQLTKDIETQRQSMIDYLDILNYMNGHSFDGPVETRQIMMYLGLAMPSLAYIDPHRTREMIYNLHLVCENLQSPYLTARVEPLNSDNIRTAFTCLACALYRKISGDRLHDELFHQTVEALYNTMERNSIRQYVCGIDTTSGRFEVLPNAMALMAYEIHDEVFGSRYYKSMKPGVMELLQDKLRDSDTGLYYESYQTGYLGYVGEFINPASAWHTRILKASVNGLAIAFMNYFDPDAVADAWQRYKAKFLNKLLTITTEAMADTVCGSFHTQLSAGSEALLGAMLAAKEMRDSEVFGKLQNVLFETGKPQMWEGHFFLPEYGDREALIGHFALFARVHVGWKTLMNHNWEKYYEWDYEKVR